MNHWKKYSWSVSSCSLVGPDLFLIWVLFFAVTSLAVRWVFRFDTEQVNTALPLRVDSELKCPSVVCLFVRYYCSSGWFTFCKSLSFFLMSIHVFGSFYLCLRCCCLRTFSVLISPLLTDSFNFWPALHSFVSCVCSLIISLCFLLGSRDPGSWSSVAQVSFHVPSTHNSVFLFFFLRWWKSRRIKASARAR